MNDRPGNFDIRYVLHNIECVKNMNQRNDMT